MAEGGWGSGTWGQAAWGGSVFDRNFGAVVRVNDEPVGALTLTGVISETVNASDTPNANVTFLSAVSETLDVSDTSSSRPLWERINDIQNPNWTPVSTQ